MKTGDALFTALMVILAFGYMKITDIQLECLDKRITDLAWRVHIVEMKLKEKQK
jgi:hypothetical protein